MKLFTVSIIIQCKQIKGALEIEMDLNHSNGESLMMEENNSV